MDLNTVKTPNTIPEFLNGGGELGQRMRDFDWSSTSLGPAETWPRSLRTCVQIMLTSRQPMWIGWGKDLIKLYNDPYKAIAGGKHPWALGKPASVVWKDIWKEIEPMLYQVMVLGEGTYVESQLLIMERNGYPEETYYTFSYTPVAGDHGHTEGMICANTDDTDRIIGDRQLRTLTQLGKSLGDVKSDKDVFVGVMDTLTKNPSDFPFALLYECRGPVLHLAAKTELGTSVHYVPDIIDINDSSGAWRLASKAIQEKKVHILEDLPKIVGFMPKGAWEVSPGKALLLPVYRRGTKDAYGLLVVGLNPYRLMDEKYLGFFELVADQVATSIANVRAIEEERHHLQALEELDRAKTAFFSNISHEFRTPLTLLLGPMEDLLQENSIDAASREKVDVAFRNGLRMQKLVNLLLDFSRIEAGKMEARFSPVNIDTITTDLASNFRSAVEKGGMLLQIDFSPLEQPVYIDVDMYEKIILNLMSNAFKYTEKGKIVVSGARNGKHAEISVSDTGVGIPLEEQERIFERFHRVQNSRGRSQEGTGIGLAMVRELVKLHGGHISVRSAPGKGSVFTVSLPLGKEHLEGRTIVDYYGPSLKQSHLAYVEEANQWSGPSDRTFPDERNTEAISPSSKAKSSKILLADDNADMRVFVQRLLENDYQVLTASDGEDAMNKALQEIPDLILSDVMMPKVDGFELLNRLKSNLTTRNIPFIFLSARAGEEAKVHGLKAGADDYLIKPFSSKELMARVANQISIASIRRKTEKEFFNLFRQSPVHIHVMKGPEHTFEFFHPLAIPFTGKDVTGMNVRDALPFVEGQGYFEMLDSVYLEGKSIQLNESKATFPQPDGTTRDHYFNIIYMPYRDVEGKVQGVLQFSTEVTETVELRLKSQTNEKKFMEIARQAPVAMAVLMGPEYIVEVANVKVLELWQKKSDEVMGKPVLTIFPEIVAQGFGSILDGVYHTGEPFAANELPIRFGSGDDERTLVFNLLYQPFRNEQGKIDGIVAIGSDVTEQVVARQKLAEAELRSRTIIEQTPSPLCIFKGENMILEVANEAALSVWQAGPEVIGKPLVEIVPEMQRQVFLALMLDVYRNGVTRYGFEAPAFFQRTNGDVENGYFNFYYVPFYGENKTITGVLVLATDVTEQVLAKKQLVDNEQRLRIASEILQLGTWEFDVLADEVYLSERSRGIFGLHSDEKVPLSEIFDLIIETDRARVSAAVESAFRGEDSGKFDQEFKVINRMTGESRAIRSIAQTFFDEAHQPQHVVGTAIDITERKKAEEKLIASEERFRVLTSSIPQFVWTTNKNGDTTFLSDQFRHYTGVDPEQGMHSWPDMTHPDDVERLKKNRMEAISKGEAWQEEFRLTDGKGGYRWFLAKAKPLKDPLGNVITYVGAASDIQDLKEQSAWLEQQVQDRTRSLKELNQSLKLSNEDLQQFAHVASHDLKEPIRKIKTFSNRLKDEHQKDLPEKAKGFLDKILSATDRMYTMIDGVLSYSTFASVDQPIDFVDLNEIIAQIRQDLEVLIAEKKMVIHSDDLPKVPGASVLLYQLFYNLIKNSLKFSRADVSPLITISFSWLTVETMKLARIVVKDNGIGFDPEQSEKIFTTFTRLNSKDRYEGTGLGLALCKKIMQRHGGSITATGEPNAGAEFTILLPVK